MRLRREPPPPSRRPALVAVALALVAAIAVVARRLAAARAKPKTAADVTSETPVTDVAEREWQCECGRRYRVTGEGRHRVFWPEDAKVSDPVIGDDCIDCGRPLAPEGDPAR